jgi:hypothetical protein
MMMTIIADGILCLLVKKMHDYEHHKLAEHQFKHKEERMRIQAM